MGTIFENHTLHIIKEDKTSEQLTGVMIQVNENESVFHVRAAKNCSIPPIRYKIGLRKLFILPYMQPRKPK